MSILLPGFRTSTQVSNEIHRGGDGDRRQRTGYLHLFQHRRRRRSEQYAEDYIMNNG